ncbi:SgcJ/EcaC family oxidoreductase [Blastococcus sp. SYSU DS0828]
MRNVVATVQRLQEQELVDEFVSLFRADAIWTTGHGKRLFGRDAIAQFTATVLPGSSAHGRATYDVEHVLFIRPDVAAVKVHQRYFDRNGDLDTEGTPMYVMAKESGRWLLTANQNTPVVKAAFASPVQASSGQGLSGRAPLRRAEGCSAVFGPVGGARSGMETTRVPGQPEPGLPARAVVPTGRPEHVLPRSFGSRPWSRSVRPRRRSPKSLVTGNQVEADRAERGEPAPVATFGCRWSSASSGCAATPPPSGRGTPAASVGRRCTGPGAVLPHYRRIRCDHTGVSRQCACGGRGPSPHRRQHRRNERVDGAPPTGPDSPPRRSRRHGHGRRIDADPAPRWRRGALAGWEPEAGGVRPSPWVTGPGW